MKQHNFFVSVQIFTNFFCWTREGCSWSPALPVFDSSLLFRHIHTQSRKLL